MCRSILVTTLILCFFSSQGQAKGYVTNAFVVQDDAGEEILANRDVACVKVDKNGKDNSATVTLLPEARRFFADYTKQNKEKSLAFLLCGRQVSKPIIKATIARGMLQVGALTAEDLQCLKSSFDIKSACRDCPVCKGP